MTIPNPYEIGVDFATGEDRTAIAVVHVVKPVHVELEIALDVSIQSWAIAQRDLYDQIRKKMEEAMGFIRPAVTKTLARSCTDCGLSWTVHASAPHIPCRCVAGHEGQVLAALADRATIDRRNPLSIVHAGERPELLLWARIANGSRILAVYSDQNGALYDFVEPVATTLKKPSRPARDPYADRSMVESAIADAMTLKAEQATLLVENAKLRRELEGLKRKSR